MSTSRRDFLHAVAAAGGLFAFKGLLRSARGGPEGGAGVWGGNTGGACHKYIRDHAAIPALKPARSVDVCVVGGGLAGLSAAYKLRDTSLLLLEHLERTGGHAQRERWNGTWYSCAAAYFVEPEAPLDALYAELKLPLAKIAEPSDSAILQWNEVTDTFGSGIGRLPYPEAARKDFARARADFLALGASDDVPVMPLSQTSEASKKFDGLTFADWLLKEQKYHPAVKRYIDLYCRSAFGAPSAEHVSAFAGLNFYVSEFADRYTFPGGTALAAERLREEIDAAGTGRILSGATVLAVEAKGERVVVTYVSASGELTAVEAKAVVMASPGYITRHLVRGIPPEQFTAMAELAWGSYVVANLLCSSPVHDGSYDTWVDTAPFTDFVVADWVARGADLKPTTAQQVLTVYYPVGHDHRVLENDEGYDSHATFRAAVLEHMDALFPGAAGKITDVRLFRWGHALCHGMPGWYTRRGHVASKTLGRILFAHSSNQGLPAFESALAEGLSAAEGARALLA